MTLQWEKIASVSGGGKPFFYIARPVMNGHKRKYSVVWSRTVEKWIASFDDMRTYAVPKKYGEFSSVKNAQASLEADYQRYLAQEVTR